MAKVVGKRMKFQARLTGEGPGGAWTFMKMPFDVQKVWGSKARVPVQGTINGFAFRSSIFPYGGGHHMMVNKQMKAGARAENGDVVRVEMEVDAAERVVKAPADLAKALATDKAAKAAFASMAYSHKKEYVDWIESAKREETRLARVAKAVGMIKEKKRLK